MKSKLKFAIPLALVAVLFGAYKVVLAKPAPKGHAKVAGHVYLLEKEFLLNLSDKRFVKLSVALVLPESEMPGEAHGGAEPPEGYGALGQEAAVRSVITDTVTGAGAADLTNRRRRAKLRRKVLKEIEQQTDVEPNDVLFTDVAVQ